MPLTVTTPEGNTFLVHSFKDFEQIFKIGYLPSLRFIDGKTQNKIEKSCAKALSKGRITSKQKWLGHYYSAEIHGSLHLDLRIDWIDEKMGYGVFANKEIPMNAFIGEYTGILRERRFFGRWKNRYCFDYNIGEGRNSGYVIDAQNFGNHTRFLNHSFEPNLEPASVYCDGILHVIVFAIKLIPANVQLCYNYGEDYWKKREKPFKI